jgi:GT2 family glycosyltransferase/glycosyltransferase involved in cell wall biosynthesis
MSAPHVGRPPAACTIISRNYLAHARVLAQSYARHEPGGRFYLLVVDGLPEGADAGAEVVVLGPDDLGLPSFFDLASTYDVTELCTAVKPSLLLALLHRRGEEAVLYFDPDILLFRPLEELRQTLAAAGIVLTPHLLKPIPLDGREPSEQDILLSGAYNLGFVAVRKSAETDEFLRWWGERLREGCRIDHFHGLFTDQKWIDLVPGLFPSTAVLRDDTYNVAYWNLHSRALAKCGESFLVNGRPLAFFHFSGFSPEKPQTLSKHQTRTDVVRGTPLAELLELYAGLLMGNGYPTCSRWSYGYPKVEGGSAGNLILRRLYHSLDEATRKQFGGPFQGAGAGSFLAWATSPRAEQGGLSPFLMYIYRTRDDLVAAFPDVCGKDRDAFLEWARTDGPRQLGYDAALVGMSPADARGGGKGAPAPSGARGASGVGADAARQRPRTLCSVIIPVYNKASLTRQCLEALLGAPPANVACEVIVVDDRSTDLTPQLLAGYGDRIRVVARPTNAGFATACNEGAAAAAGELLVFLNNDTVPQPGWLDALAGYAEGHPRAAVVGAKLLFPDDTVQHAGLVVCQDGYPRHIYTGFPADHPAVNKSRRFQIVTGACMLVRRALFERVGGFDTAYKNGFEDVDLCLRLGERGHEVHYCHESVVYHLECVSRKVGGKHDHRNTNIYRDRWLHRVRPDEMQYYLEDGLFQLDYRPLYPLGLKLSPLLAVVSGGERERRADRLLEARSGQVLALLRENIRLGVRVREAELNAGAGPTVNGRPRRRLPRAGTDAPGGFGVNVAGFLTSEKGLGEAVRGTVRSLQAANVPYVLNNFIDPGSANRDTTFAEFSDANPYDVNLVQVNVNVVPEFIRHKGEAYLEGRYNIAYWYWELSDFPPEWASRLEPFDEVWVGSGFALDALSRAADVPVIRMPPCLPERLPTAGCGRDHFGLPRDRFLFLFVFDFHSSLERKNPLGLIAAFKKAFAGGDDALLVLKCSHSRDCPAEFQAVTAASRGANIRILDGVFSREEVNALLALSDCYVSLHRSEGFGLPLAEAMSLEKPVIATAYSGNMDFMTLSNSFLTKYRLTEITRDHGPYKKGSAWADPDLDHAAELMRFVYENRGPAGEVGRLARQDVLHGYRPEAVGKRIKQRLLQVAGWGGAEPVYGAARGAGGSAGGNSYHGRRVETF